VEQWHVN